MNMNGIKYKNAENQYQESLAKILISCDMLLQNVKIIISIRQIMTSIIQQSFHD